MTYRAGFLYDRSFDDVLRQLKKIESLEDGSAQEDSITR